jgi:hypothetical protein
VPVKNVQPLVAYYRQHVDPPGAVSPLFND